MRSLFDRYGMEMFTQIYDLLYRVNMSKLINPDKKSVHNQKASRGRPKKTQMMKKIYLEKSKQNIVESFCTVYSLYPSIEK